MRLGDTTSGDTFGMGGNSAVVDLQYGQTINSWTGGPYQWTASAYGGGYPTDAIACKLHNDGSGQGLQLQCYNPDYSAVRPLPSRSLAHHSQANTICYTPHGVRDAADGVGSGVNGCGDLSGTPITLYAVMI